MSDSFPKKALLLADIPKHSYIDKVIVESIEQALFRLEVEIQGQRYYVLESPGKSLSRRNIIEIQAVLTPFHVGSTHLYHRSPYDEMIGHEVNVDSNEMLVPLGDYFADEARGPLHCYKTHDSFSCYDAF